MIRNNNTADDGGCRVLLSSVVSGGWRFLATLSKETLEKVWQSVNDGGTPPKHGCMVVLGDVRLSQG